MFVFHCKIDETRTVTPMNADTSNSKRKLKKGKRLKTGGNNELNHELTNNDDIFRPVQCSECGTEVGVYEPKEELYHFANVLASH